MSRLPLDGVTVIDFGQIFQGSYASVLMAKAGARVIKVEPPRGEPLRQRVPPGRKSTLPFAMLNANKRGITLNLKAPRGKELLFEMVRRADVLLENFAPGAMDALGVGWSVLHAVNPRLIYATASGYGISGPDKEALAMDLTVQAASGIMSVTGYPDKPPVRAGITVADFMGGTHLYAGIMTALFEREHTGEGRLVEIAMQESVYYTLAAALESYSRHGKVPPRVGNNSGGSAAPYGLYPLQDGWLAVHPGTEQHWRNILQAAGREDLLDDPRFRTMHDRAAHLEETNAIVSAWTSRLTKAEAIAIARKFKIPCSPVRDVSEVMHDPHMHERGMLETVDHPDLGRVVLPTTPLRLHGAGVAPAEPSPRLGQHNADIYGTWLGLGAAEIEELRRQGVI
ncbi:CaiB/BaiF CoA transferase family protein [Rhodopila sp.]|uniref:CaiB/BaiF CoA transferase family protein n=1 Tax=Rhodopila sp. TaxID=2480087 RepID=UPI002D124FF6|nr:CoA transferase [Rhodopila sp.]HVZ09487.1 CoA transferase [Rhodopila sp.]